MLLLEEEEQVMLLDEEEQVMLLEKEEQVVLEVMIQMMLKDADLAL